MKPFDTWDFKEWVITALESGQKDILCNLEDADLWHANLQGADLRHADLWDANLWHADLQGADLRGTILDPGNTPNADTEAFARVDEWVLGWRTPNSPIIGGPGYAPGGIKYTAPVFSTCPETECHPGLYLRPIKEQGDIMVLARAEDIHRVGGKWRCRKFVTA